MKKHQPRRRLFSLTLRQQNIAAGYLFSLPFILGFVFVFLYPTILSAVFSLNELVITKTGYALKYVGFENYRHVFQVHPTFIRDLTETTINMLSQVFWVLVFSFFAAIVLNQKFRGRLIARAILFLPIIMASGIILKIEARDYMTGILEYGMESVSTFLVTPALSVYLSKFQLPDALIENILAAIESLPNIIRSSGIQILVLLAGLQAIPSSLYEASEVEGATAWENFWLITLPMVSPLILTNIIYTIVDYFTSPSNLIVTNIRAAAFGTLGYGVGSAMSWVYFGVIGTILAITFLIFSRFVFYHE
ncbi:MAG: sugar ABC transporter permease [Firmicutes bacterium]|jgi:ABC-type sugar transport system permease subunit|nr:sugar ABC transporter permease [Bacillota bacterium]NLL87634.1 sugar ABC transporter permease [Bacillota bacterium]HKM17951.1 sugar ABC transporter permease [Limnochordia bacterium]